MDHFIIYKNTKSLCEAPGWVCQRAKSSGSWSCELGPHLGIEREIIGYMEINKLKKNQITLMFT